MRLSYACNKRLTASYTRVGTCKKMEWVVTTRSHFSFRLSRYTINVIKRRTLSPHGAWLLIIATHAPVVNGTPRQMCYAPVADFGLYK